MADFVKIGAEWRTKSGKGYNCTVQQDMKAGCKFLIFSNKNKKEDKHPDIILGYFDDSEDKRQEKRDNWENAPANDDITF